MKPKAAPARNQRVSSRSQRKQQHLLDVKVRSRAATRQRNRRLLALVSALLLICGAVGGAWYGGREALRHFFWCNPDYNLAVVSVHTDGPLTRDQIVRTANIQEGKNIFSVNLSAARKALMALPQVERAEIERSLPNRISIDIVERKPVAWVTGKEDGNTDPGAFLIDRDGTLLRLKYQVPAYYHLPVICGLAVENYEEGDVVDLPEVAAALQLIRLTGENPARYQARSIDISRGYCLVVTDERHAKVTFPLENIGAQLDRLALLLANIDGSKRDIQTVNLLVQRNVPVTFAMPPDPNAANASDAAAKAFPSPAAAKASASSKKAQDSSADDKPAVKHARPAHIHHHVEPMIRRAIPVSPLGA